MSEDRRSRNTSSRRRRLPPWLDPDAPSAWWSPDARRSRVVDQAPHPPPYATSTPPEPPHVDADPPRPNPVPPPPPEPDSFLDALRDWARNPEFRDWARTTAI